MFSPGLKKILATSLIGLHTGVVVVVVVVVVVWGEGVDIVVVLVWGEGGDIVVVVDHVFAGVVI